MSEQEWIFTFGFGHSDPDTGESLSNCFIRICGTNDEARQQMVARFGRRWAFQYRSADEAGVDRYGLREVYSSDQHIYKQEEK